MAHGQGATSNRRGGYGPFDRGTRGHGKDKAVKKAERREHDDRVQSARAEVAEAEERLASLVAEGGPDLPGAACTRCGERPPKGTSAWCGKCQELIGKSIPVVVPPNPNNLKLRPCAKNGREEKHPGHEWEAGGTGVERWCVGFPVPGSYAEGLTAEKLKGRSAVVIPEGHELTISVLPEDDAGDGKWPMAYTTARMMLKQGYNIKHVTKFTGIKADELRDIPVDDEGYGIRKEEEE